MTNFEYYYHAWTLYVILGLTFNGLFFFLIRKWPKWLILILLAGSMAFTFTSLTTEPETETLAPALVVAIFELEASVQAKEGIDGLWRGMGAILINWLLILILAALADVGYWFYRNKYQQEDTKQPNT